MSFHKIYCVGEFDGLITWRCPECNCQHAEPAYGCIKRDFGCACGAISHLPVRVIDTWIDTHNRDMIRTKDRERARFAAGLCEYPLGEQWRAALRDARK